jgi:hypothetical protein
MGSPFAMQFLPLPAALKGSDMRENILSGEPLPFHDLPNTSSARYPEACYSQLRFKKKAALNEGSK